MDADRLRVLRDEYGDYDENARLGAVYGTATIGEFLSAINIALADRAAQAERMARLEEAVNFVARWAWRADPPNANNKLSDTERISCIKHYPTIKDAAKPHIDLAKAESARALSQEGSE